MGTEGVRLVLRLRKDSPARLRNSRCNLSLSRRNSSTQKDRSRVEPKLRESSALLDEALSRFPLCNDSSPRVGPRLYPNPTANSAHRGPTSRVFPLLSSSSPIPCSELFFTSSLFPRCLASLLFTSVLRDPPSFSLSFLLASRTPRPPPSSLVFSFSSASAYILPLVRNSHWFPTDPSTRSPEHCRESRRAVVFRESRRSSGARRERVGRTAAARKKNCHLCLRANQTS